MCLAAEQSEVTPPGEPALSQSCSGLDTGQGLSMGTSAACC